MRRVGYYAALAALLAILGSASHAYRERGNEPESEAAQPQKSVDAVTLLGVAPTPEPTQAPPQWVWPLQGEILGAYTPGEPVWSETLRQWQTHPALDIAGSPGEAVYACRDGVVQEAWSDRLWGNTIILEHEEGYRSVYSGLNTLQLVTEGQSVTAGQVISSVGKLPAGESEMPYHLHFELTRDGEPADFQALVDKDR